MGEDQKEEGNSNDKEPRNENEKEHCFKIPSSESSCFLRKKSSTPTLLDDRQIATNTIMITNNMNGNKAESSTNNSKITILGESDRRLVVDQINICINNHFSSDSVTTTTTATASSLKQPSTLKKIPDLIQIQKDTIKTNLIQIKKEKLEEDEEKNEEKSLEKNKKNQSQEKQNEKTAEMENEKQIPFKVGDEVLAHRKTLDNRFYLGVIVTVQAPKCLVRFEDNTGCWSRFDELKRLANRDDKQAPLFCVICKEVKGNGKRRDEDVVKEEKMDVDEVEEEKALVCQLCARGYHKRCLDAEAKELNLLEKFTQFPGIQCLRCLRRKLEQKSDHRKTKAANTINDTGNFYPFNKLLDTNSWLSTDNMDRDDLMDTALEADELEEEGGEGDVSREDELFNYVNGRRLRKRQEVKNYAENARRPVAAAPSSSASPTVTVTAAVSSLLQSSNPFQPSSASSFCSYASSSSSSSSSSCSSSVASSFSSSSLFSLSNFSTAFLSQKHRLLQRKLKQRSLIATVPYSVAPPLNKIFETQNRLARGEKYAVRGKRMDKNGHVQYLVEWEGVS